ncbi:KOW domain-containing RNA-binding protein [Fervidibacillus albus]|uniref:KOW domain-containing RNA-binding protein n=2 Tax=Fervidibacillus albus TaxID=2980026 RepID=A0A9E8LTU1_9BACI|nr:KOW domain-containing RNA-binding protein [Fervidibacillus albus]WAA09411.1 KOW domain-containing RNA-binding protein [Fervidibacillus albus]
MDPDSCTHIGRVVRIKKGRDAGQFALIINHLNERFVLLADGVKRKFDRPKKKNINHIELLEYVSPEVRNSIIETGRVTNNKLRHALRKFQDEHLAEEKGDDLNGERRCH